VNTPPDESLSRQLLAGEGVCIVGDVGFAVAKSILELPIGYVVTGWGERPTPIDAALDDVARAFLEPAGVAMRRMRGIAELERSLGDLSTRGAGVVVWAGVSGLRPALERFSQLTIPSEGPVVALTFDVGALHCSEGLVIDPEPGISALRAAVVDAMDRSSRACKPVIVIVRPATVGARASFIAENNLGATERAVGWQTHSSAPRSAVSAPVGGDVVVCGSPIGRHVEESLQGSPARALAVIAPVDLDGQGIRELIANARRVLLIEDSAAPALHERLLASPFREPASLAVVRIAYNDAFGADIAAIVEAWQAEAREEIGDPVVGADSCVGSDDSAVAAVSRIERPRRELPSYVETALITASSNLGLPVRLDLQVPSYGIPAGGSLTIASIDALIDSPYALVPESARSGCLVTWGDLSRLAELTAVCAEIGMRVEVHDGGRPRAVAQAIAGAARGGGVAMLVTPPPHVRATGGSEIGVEPDLIEGNDLALGGVPREAVIRVGLPGPSAEIVETSLVPSDEELVRGALPGALELGDGWYNVSSISATGITGRARTAWRRWIQRNVARVDS
jgi:hypothetical protein